MNESIVVRINPAEIVKLQQDGKSIVFDAKAESAIVRLLEIQREVYGAVEWLKSEIERQALEFNPNFTSVKGDKIKVNYSAAGAKYKGETKKHDPKYWKKNVSWTINAKAVDKYLAKYYKCPSGIAPVERTKTIRISEVRNDG